ncbi:GNAT family N-acetyltransferase [Jatrophihabitans sp.]|uniref:GNAT family N-acetyltransferase n=1 Tax=Jatrophihabitans sp. TaxID=1932789 RepID=UPI002D082DF2|nr:GNAT family N-acetyltransferase [Jatrophihabitans sp.]
MTEQIPRLLSSQGAPPLRPAGSSDQAVLLRVFTEAHCAGFELLGMEPAALAGLVGMQYRARQAQYSAAHPEAVEYLICGSDGSPVGSCWLDDTPGQLRVLDIAVLREHRRRGIARAVLGSLCEQAAAAGKPVRLSVWHENVAALELYRSLGFTTPAGSGDPADGGDLGNGYLELQFVPDRAPRLRAGAR